MEYTINQLAQLSGVSTRTLRWYHEKGLLLPSRVGDNSYRYYGEAEVDRLQEILYFRHLGVGLEGIKVAFAESSGRLDTLKHQLTALEAERERIDQLIASLQESIQSKEWQIPMENEKKFQALKQQSIEANEATYGVEIREKYGNEAINQSNEKLMGLSQEAYHAWEVLGETLLQALETAVAAGVAYTSDEGNRLVALHKQWLSYTMPSYSPALHQGLARMYVGDERFLAYYDRRVDGCGVFLSDAILHWTAGARSK